MIFLALTLTALTQAPAAGACTLEGTLTLKDGLPSDAVVYLKDGPPRARPEPETHVIKQKSLKFIPSSMVVLLNDRINFVNDDGDATEHSVFSRLGMDPFDGDRNKRSTTFTRTFTREGPVHIQSNIHQTMTTDVLVLRSAAFTRPDAKGKWSITGLERKAYTLVVWEPNGGELRREVAACGTGALALDLTKKVPPLPLRRDGTRYRPEYEDATY